MLRQQHYWFAHRLVPNHRDEVALDRHDTAERIRVEQMLAELWDQAGMFAGDHDDPGDLRVVGWSERGDVSLTLVAFPPPKNALECFAAVLAATPDEIRYFVLERGFDDDDGSHRVYVAEYSTQGVRVRYGDLPDTSLERFIDRVADLVAFSSAEPELGEEPAPTLDIAPARHARPDATTEVVARQVAPRPSGWHRLEQAATRILLPALLVAVAVVALLLGWTFA